MPFAFLLPALGLYVVFFIYPFIFAFILSFQKWNLISPNKEFVGLDNYRRLLHDEVFWISLKNSALYVLLTVPFAMGIGLALALAVESLWRGKRLYRMIFFLPVVSSISIISIVWSLMYNEQVGAINVLLRMFGIQGPNWMNDPATALWSLAIVGIWKGFGYNMVLYISGLKSVDRTLYEAASMDGAGRWKQFRHVTLPMLSPVTFFILVMSIISSFQVFTTIQIMTRGGPNNATNVLVYQIYQEAFQFFNIGVASASSTILLLLVGTLTVIQLRLSRKTVHYQ
ncbi:binding--dependent transport system inner membrane component family protein [Paenibacillus macerans]|uniref:Binding--dependent transport system inner membrane component family protein n=1 Tax=Paenibacillus macerans TaxID=44252 RepID=A0A091A275_PAEMA|nr:sugar ABC transporter permease [Paenibacillus macerans]KFN10411.1 binding--dependent transport system inner membrane component family protein [Paenibacillus macerans]